MTPDDASSRAPIGIFDSGLGGLTVLQEIERQLPDEDTVYFGDSGRAPYGTKSHDTIVKFALQDMRFLLEHRIKALVIACNTASAHAFDEIRAEAGIPVLEVIGPGAMAAAQATRNGRIGIIGTQATVDSGVYLRAVETLTPLGVVIHQQACPLFVGLAEEGWWENDIARRVAVEYLAPLRKAGIDTLVLGCTHYPLLKKVISEAMGPSVALIDSATEVARATRSRLALAGLGEPPRVEGHTARHVFYTSDSAERFRQLGGAFLRKEIAEAHKVEIERF